MPTALAIPVEEYLRTAYRPDCDYVDGELVERNMGEWTHGKLQSFLIRCLYRDFGQLGIEVVPEIRVQVRPGRFRVPDVCVTLGDPGEEVLTRPPFLCIEILSPEDRFSRIRERVEDYLDMGVPHVWVLDPYGKRAYTADRLRGIAEATGDTLAADNPRIVINLAEAFAR